MKVAFLISGRTRNYIYQAHTFYQKVFNHVDGDIFISFQKDSRLFNDEKEILEKIPEKLRMNINDKIDDETYLSNLFDERLKYFGYDDEDKIQTEISYYLEEFKKRTEKYSQKFDYSQPKTGKVYWNLDQYARVKNIAEIFEKNSQIRYDMIVRLRLDQLLWIDDFNLNQFEEKNCIYFDFNKDWKKSTENGLSNWVKDFMFFGDQDMMIYCMKNIVSNLYLSTNYLIIYPQNASIPEVLVAMFINRDKNLNKKLRHVDIPHAFWMNLYGIYTSGYYLGKRENIDKYFSDKLK